MWLLVEHFYAWLLVVKLTWLVFKINKNANNSGWFCCFHLFSIPLCPSLLPEWANFLKLTPSHSTLLFMCKCWPPSAYTIVRKVADEPLHDLIYFFWLYLPLYTKHIIYSCHSRLHKYFWIALSRKSWPPIFLFCISNVLHFPS